MKKIITITTIALGLFSVSCTEESSLDQLKTKQGELKEEINQIKTKIALLDTTSESVILLVTSSEVLVKGFQHKIELQGAVETDQNILINSESAGIIRNIHVKEGQKVTKGQTLITIDAEIIQNSINEINTALEMADYMYDKQLALHEQGLGTEIELKQAKNQKKSLESKLKTLQSQKGKTIVSAPFSGSIDQIFTQIGEMASPQAPLIRLVNNKNIRITANVSENHLGNINIGTGVDVVFPSLNDTTIQTKVSYLGRYIDPVNRTFRIHVELNNNTIFLPNQIAKIRLIDLDLDSVLVVDSQSILQDTDNNNYVYKMLPTNKEVDEYKIEKVYIKIVKSYKDESAIKTIKPNQLLNNSKLVLNGGKGVIDGDVVKVQ
jgi:membrane fusion protein (multidrug efflux system)